MCSFKIHNIHSWLQRVVCRLFLVLHFASPTRVSNLALTEIWWWYNRRENSELLYVVSFIWININATLNSKNVFRRTFRASDECYDFFWFLSGYDFQRYSFIGKYQIRVECPFKMNSMRINKFADMRSYFERNKFVKQEVLRVQLKLR